jgi:hypothetical protein
MGDLRLYFEDVASADAAQAQARINNGTYLPGLDIARARSDIARAYAN